LLLFGLGQDGLVGGEKGPLMTRNEWLACTDPDQLLDDLAGNVSERKLRLFACACCRRIEPLLPEGSRQTVEVAEKYADGLVDESVLEAYRVQARAVTWAAIEAVQGAWAGQLAQASANWVVVWASCAAEEAAERHLAPVKPEWAPYETVPPVSPALRAARAAAWAWTVAREQGIWPRNARADEDEFAYPTEEARQCEMLRDLLGNRIYPVSIQRDWLLWHDGLVGRMAEQIALEQRFEDLPILADALSDAGCDDTVLLDHCRSGRLHTRGCWALDLLRGLEA
jgi:hypothetical protein